MRRLLGLASLGKKFTLYGLNRFEKSQIFRDHDDVIKWKRFPRYWQFVRGIHRWPVHSPHKCRWRGALMFSLICALNKRLSKQSWGWWFETPLRLLWRHCNALGCHRHPSSWNTHLSIIVGLRMAVAMYGAKPSAVMVSWWCHQMEKFSPLLALCAGNSPVPGQFPSQRPVTHSFDVFFNLRLN